jgi:hypothetical protein
MRIRQIKPEFWSDSEMAALPYPVRLLYIGLWCVADDAGYIDWRPDRIAHDLLGYESTKTRERHLVEWAEELVRTEHLQLLECGQCAWIPTLSKHQRIAGKQNFKWREFHATHAALSVVPTSQRDRLIGRDGLTCRYCSKEVTTRTLVLAHLDPSGPATDDNLVVACRTCNFHQGRSHYAAVGFSLRPLAAGSAQSLPIAPERSGSGNGTERTWNGSAPESQEEPTEFRRLVAAPK